MNKIRADLVGVVMAGGRTFAAGDEIPEGISVHESLLDLTSPEPKDDEPKADEPKADEPKADEPKADEPKAEEPKAEEPKAEEPKAEESKTDEDDLSDLIGESEEPKASTRGRKAPTKRS